MSSDVFESYTQIKELRLNIAGKLYPVKEYAVQASVGSIASCNVNIVHGDVFNVSSKSVLDTAAAADYSDNAFAAGQSCTVELVLSDGGVKTLFKGVLMGVSKGQAVSDKAVQSTLSLTIVMSAAKINAVPVANLSLVTNVNGAKIMKTGFATMNNRTLSQHTSAEFDKSLNVNVAEYIVQIIDGVCFADKAKTNNIKLIAGGSAGLGGVVDTGTCPRMTSVPSGSISIANKISYDVISMLSRGMAYYDVLIAMLSTFYLTVVPDIVNDRLKVLPAIAWRKKISKTLSTFTALSSSFFSTGKNAIDAVIVGYSQAAKTDKLDNPSPEGAVVFGECSDGGKPRAITSPSELYELDAVSPRKYITVMLPEWLVSFATPVSDKSPRAIKSTPNQQDPVCTDYNQEDAGYNDNMVRWASMIARTTFAKYNRAGATAHVVVPLDTWLDCAVDNLGHVVSVQCTDNSISKVTNKEVVGMVQQISMSIRIAPTQLQIQCAITLSHVRTPEENDILGIDDCIYADTW